MKIFKYFSYVFDVFRVVDKETLTQKRDVC